MADSLGWYSYASLELSLVIRVSPYLQEAGRAEQHIVTEAAPNELKLGGGA